jgi:hypothetical protein
MLDTINLPEGLQWFDFETKVFNILSPNYSMTAVRMSILLIKPNFDEDPFLGGSFGRNGYHSNGLNTWIVFEFNVFEDLEKMKVRIYSCIKNIVGV